MECNPKLLFHLLQLPFSFLGSTQWSYIVSFFIDCHYYNNLYCSNNASAIKIKIRMPCSWWKFIFWDIISFYIGLGHFIIFFAGSETKKIPPRTCLMNFVSQEVILYSCRSADQTCMKYCNLKISTWIFWIICRKRFIVLLDQEFLFCWTLIHLAGFLFLILIGDILVILTNHMIALLLFFNVYINRFFDHRARSSLVQRPQCQMLHVCPYRSIAFCKCHVKLAQRPLFSWFA